TGLTNASADTFSVAAVNANGDSAPATYGPIDQTLSGTLLAPAPLGQTNAPVPNDQVSIYDLPQSTTPNQTLIATVQTGSNGSWTYTLPPFADLPAAVQADAVANGGILNTEIDGYALADGY